MENITSRRSYTWRRPPEEDALPGEKLLTVKETAKKLRVDDTTVRRWIANGILDAITLPHKGKRQAYRIRERTIRELIEPGETA